MSDNPGDYGESTWERWGARLLLLAGGVVVVLLLPALTQLYALMSTKALAWLFDEPPETFDSAVGRAVAGLVWLVAALLAAAAALMLSRRLRARRLMLLLASLAAAGLLLVPLLSAMELANRQAELSSAQVATLVAFVCVVLGMAVFVHNRRYSMHLFYRERLNSAFALQRERDDRGCVVAAPISYREKLYFTDLRPAPDLPKPWCAAR